MGVDDQAFAAGQSAQVALLGFHHPHLTGHSDLRCCSKARYLSAKDMDYSQRLENLIK